MPLDSKEKVRLAWEELNGAKDERGPADDAGRFLLAAAAVGPRHRAQIARLADLSPFAVSRLMRRARSAGIIGGGEIRHSGWFDEETGGVAFILDVCVLDGTLERVPSRRAA